MLTSPVIIAYLDPVNAVNTEMALISGPANGRTLRRSADRVQELTIAHNNSNENPGYLTQRSNVRISRRKAVPDTDKSVVGYVQLTSSIPLDVFTEADVRDLCAQLLTLVKVPDFIVGTSTAEERVNMDLVPRLLAGES